MAGAPSSRLLAGGLSSLAWARPRERASSRRSRPAVSQLLGNLLPVGGWRIYTISGSMPVFDPRRWRLEVDGLVGSRELRLRRAAGAAARQQVSTFHCVTGWTVTDVHWAGVRFAGSARPRRAAADGARGAVRLARGAVRRLAHARPGAAPRRDARARAWTARRCRGRTASPARVVIPEMYGYKGVKWLDADRARRRRSRTATGKASATTRTPGWAAPMATQRLSRDRRLPRFSAHRARAALDPRHRVHRPARERALPLPAEPRRARRPAPAAQDDPHLHRRRWAVALVLVVVVGDRRALRRTVAGGRPVRADDRAWLRRPRRPQGRLNAGQKLNAIVTAAFAILFAVTGFFLWYGERDTRFRLAERAARPRLADVRLARPVRRAPLSSR